MGEQAFVQAKLAETYAELEADFPLVHATLRGDQQLQFAMLRGSSIFRLPRLHCHPDERGTRSGGL